MIKLYQKLPPTPGVYLMKNVKGEILYIGKAVNLRRRVSSYFSRAHDYRIEKLMSLVKKIDYKKTDTALEALILESELIKKHQPPFNVLEKDDKSFLYVEITREKFPRILLIRGTDLKNTLFYDRRIVYFSGKKEKAYTKKNAIFGPFTSSSALREALKIIRRIFPYSTHDFSRKSALPSKVFSHKKFGRACFDYQIGLCSGTCIGAVSVRDYAKTIKNIKLFFSGKKKQILKSLQKEMREASKNLEFEKAEKIKRQIFALKHIQDIAFISESDTLLAIPHTLYPRLRIEGYDISNISGTSAVGSMVVFTNSKPDKNQYRKLKIYSIKGPDDTGMIKEVLSRRLKHQEWPLPDLILIDGGRGQVNAVKSALAEASLKIPVVGIAKGPKRNKNEFIGDFKLLHYAYDRTHNVVKKVVAKKTLIQVRDEAHRFAISFHKKSRAKNFLTRQ